MKRVRAVALSLVTLLAACSEESIASHPPLPEPQAAAAPVSFVNKVWRVSESAQVAPGSLYVFLSEGTLVMASAHGSPSFGKWKQEAGELSMIEDGLAYKVRILKLTDNIFRIRSLNPGEPVEMMLVPAQP